jgi:hypothetical protein
MRLPFAIVRAAKKEKGKRNLGETHDDQAYAVRLSDEDTEKDREKSTEQRSRPAGGPASTKRLKAESRGLTILLLPLLNSTLDYSPYDIKSKSFSLETQE